jgi:uncharacterized membrane protein YkvI
MRSKTNSDSYAKSLQTVSGKTQERNNTMLTVFLILAVAAFIVTVASAASPSRAPLWVAVLILTIIELLRALPLGR